MRGRPREALPYFDHAFRLSPRDPLRAGWHTWIGIAHMMLGDDRKALEESKRSAAANPQSAGAFTLQAAALALLGRQDEARAALAMRQQLGPPDLTITTNQGGLRSPTTRNTADSWRDTMRVSGRPGCRSEACRAMGLKHGSANAAVDRYR